MDLPVNVDVYCATEDCGRSTYVVLNPVTMKVTHVVVKQKSYPFADRLVPVELVTASTPQMIRLRCTKDELAGMERFIQTQFIQSEDTRLVSGPYMMWPFSYPTTEFIPLEHEQVPVGELAIRRGAIVHARDGRVGRVDEFLVDPTSEHITHLVMREGHLWGQKDVTIPVSDIDFIQEHAVYLKVDKDEIEALPAVPIHRG